MMYKLIYPIVGAAFLFGTGAATAQTTPKATQNEPAAKSDSVMKSDAAKMTLTEAQASSWVDKPIYSSDGKEIGEVASFKRSADNAVLEMHADVGGALGMGESRVKLTPQQFKLQTDRVVLTITEEQAKKLPKVQS